MNVVNISSEPSLTNGKKIILLGDRKVRSLTAVSGLSYASALVFYLALIQAAAVICDPKLTLHLERIKYLIAVNCATRIFSTILALHERITTRR